MTALFIFNPFGVGILIASYPALHAGLFILDPSRINAALIASIVDIDLFPKSKADSHSNTELETESTCTIACGAIHVSSLRGSGGPSMVL